MYPDHVTFKLKSRLRKTGRTAPVQYLLCPKVMGQQGQQTAITDTKAHAVRLQHLREKNHLNTGFLMVGQEILVGALTEMLPFF